MTNIINFDYIIIGGGIAGVTAANTLATLPIEKPSILMVNNEDRLPYKRTKINKNIYSGFTKSQFYLHPREWYINNNITLVNGEPHEIDKNLKTIKINNITYNYKKLLIATGSTPRTVGSAEWDNHIMHIRKACEAEKIIAKAKTGNHFVIIGGGSEGVETAVELAALGKKVTIIDRNSTILHNYMPVVASEMVEKELLLKNIKLLKNQRITNIAKQEEYHIQTTDFNLQCDAIIGCIGTKPNLDMAVMAGIKTSKGVLVNEYLQTDNDSIFAAGDVAEHDRNVITGLWHAAEHQGKIAALNMAGIPTKFTNPTFRFKTDLYGIFCFSGGYCNFSTSSSIITTTLTDTWRQIAVSNDKIVGIVSVNEKALAPIFQKALFEGWTVDELNKNIKS